MKTCRTCGEVKPLSEFPLRYDKRRPMTSRQAYCKACKVKGGAGAGMSNAQQLVIWRANNRARDYALKQRWAKSNPERMALIIQAGRVVDVAKRAGILVEATACEGCSRSGRTESAHYDYSEPLRVRWLCKPCHNAWDRASPKSLAAEDSQH